MLALRRRHPQLHSVRLVRHERALGMHAEREAAGARRAERRAQRLRVLHAAHDCRAPDEHPRRAERRDDERPRPASSEQSRDAASGGGAPRAGDEGYPAERVRGAGAAGLFKDSRIRFLGTPAGYEFMSLINAVLLVGGRESNLTESNRKKIAAVATPLTFQVFTTPT